VIAVSGNRGPTREENAVMAGTDLKAQAQLAAPRQRSIKGGTHDA